MDDLELLESQVTEIQMLYPRLYMACHVDHVKARSSEAQLSARDSALLSHLSAKAFSRPQPLAKHLNITLSTLSEALHHLVGLGYVAAKTDEDDERRTSFKLTAKGVTAMKSASVLDSTKLGALMARLSNEEREQAIAGLKLLADAAMVQERTLDKR